MRCATNKLKHWTKLILGILETSLDCRNRNKKQVLIAGILDAARQNCYLCKRLCPKSEEPRMQSSKDIEGSQKKKWSPPPLNSYKTNFDGAMFNELSEAGICVVIKNCKGKVMTTRLEKKFKNHNFLWPQRCQLPKGQPSLPVNVASNNPLLKEILSF